MTPDTSILLATIFLPLSSCQIKNPGGLDGLAGVFDFQIQDVDLDAD